MNTSSSVLSISILLGRYSKARNPSNKMERAANAMKWRTKKKGALLVASVDCNMVVGA